MGTRGSIDMTVNTGALGGLTYAASLRISSSDQICPNMA